MRIITGTARGVRLNTPPGQETRPTAERVKEAIFSALHFDIPDKRVLELFGGSGQLGLEALSRGAASATILDNQRTCVEIIKQNSQKTKLQDRCTVLLGDWKDYLQKNKGAVQYDIVFLDPPYSQGYLDEVITAVLDADVLSDNAKIVCESPKEGIPAIPEGMEGKVYRYGNTYVTIIKHSR